LRHLEKLLADYRGELTPQQLAAIDTAAQELRTAVAGDDLTTLQEAISTLVGVARPLTELAMNRVTKQALGGKAADTLDPTRL
jgi:hypothetical protein